jgi:glucokinase
VQRPYGPPGRGVSTTPVVLGIDFGGTKIAAALCTLAGVRIDTATVDSLGSEGAAASIARGIEAARALKDSAAPGRRLAGVGVCTFGIPGEDRVDLAPAIPGWDSLAFGRELRSAFPGVPLRMATDVKAAAQAELRWGSLAGCDPAIYLNLGTGLAAAIIAGGRVIGGAHGAAGEIGYNLRSPQDVDVPRSDRVILEHVVSGRALADLASAALGRPVSAADAFELAETQADADALVEQFVQELAMHLVNLAVAVDPVRIAVGGGMMRSWSRIEPELRRALEDAVPFPPQLVPAEFPYDAPLIGALALGLEAAGTAPSEKSGLAASVDQEALA